MSEVDVKSDFACVQSMDMDMEDTATVMKISTAMNIATIKTSNQCMRMAIATAIVMEAT